MRVRMRVGVSVLVHVCALASASACARTFACACPCPARARAQVRTCARPVMGPHVHMHPRHHGAHAKSTVFLCQDDDQDDQNLKGAPANAMVCDVKTMSKQPKLEERLC